MEGNLDSLDFNVLCLAQKKFNHQSFQNVVLVIVISMDWYLDFD